MRLAIFVAAMVAFTAGTALADGILCCGTKTCPTGKVENPDQTACCEPDGSGCVLTANLGRRCNDDLAAALTGIPDRENVAGCVETDAACVGGQIGDDSGPVAGCVCVGDYCEADVDFPDGKVNCTRIAVDACCDAGACL